MRPGLLLARGFTTSLASRLASTLMSTRKVFSRYQGLDQARTEASFSIINLTSQQPKIPCVPYQRGSRAASQARIRN